jgi:hypothetical protein
LTGVGTLTVVDGGINDADGLANGVLQINNVLLGTYVITETISPAGYALDDVVSRYVPVPILIAAYAVALRHRRPEAARGLAIGAGILAASLVFRTLDAGICPAFPLGTHFLWHVLNAVMLGWMIGVVVEGRGPASLRR